MSNDTELPISYTLSKSEVSYYRESFPIDYLLKIHVGFGRSEKFKMSYEFAGCFIDV